MCKINAACFFVPKQIAGNNHFSPAEKKNNRNIIEFLMVLLVIIGIVLVLMVTVIVPVGL